HSARPALPAPLAPFPLSEWPLLEEPRLFASTFELRDEPSYTIQTLEHFTGELPGAELHLVIGSDSLAELHTWRRWQELASLARIVVLARPGWEPAAVRAALA